MRITKEKESKLTLKESSKEEENGAEGKTVLVGVRMDAESRELLTWALVKVAEAGDRVVALHVLPSAVTNASHFSDLDGNPSSLLSLVKAFDSVLAVYEGFCNLKQIDLKLKLCRGSSVRKALVQEVNAFSAVKLILGVNKKSRNTGSSSTSVAKYCAKKLGHNCSVIAVNNGKIVFQRAPPPPSSRAIESGHPAWLVSISWQAWRKSSSNPKNYGSASKTSFHCSNAVTKGGLNSLPIGINNSSLATTVLREENCSICNEPKKEESLALVPVQKPEGPSTSISVVIRELPEVRPGWPLLRRFLLSDRKASPLERSKASFVHWAMRLPSWYPSAVHPSRKIMKAEANAASNSDGESKAIVPVDANLSSQSVAIHDEEGKLPKELESLQEKYSSVCRLFTYKELMRATSNLSPENLIGKGGSSRVYKGCLSDGKELAVKILKSSKDAMKEFILEIEIITALHHNNIVSLFGFCFENNNLLLVYDFLSRGSLEENLHGEEEKRKSLGWVKRYKVAVGVAEALDYLHGGSSGQPVIHRDVKSSNILLSDDFEPQLSDFGLAQWSSTAASNTQSSDVAGTFGYLAPEYFMYGKVTEKIDVYAFGVVLLELISGRKPISTGNSKSQESLVVWAKPILQGGKANQLLDPFLSDKYNHDQLERMMLAASLCIRRAPQSRPRITLVLKLIQGDENVLKWAREQVSASEEFDGLDYESACLDSNIQSHINLALLETKDDPLSVSSIEPCVDFITANTSLEEYLKGRWSRSSSFD